MRAAGNHRTKRNRDEQLLAALELASDVLVEIDFNGIITCISGGAQALLGCNAVDLTGIDLMTFVHPDDRVRLAQNCRELRLGGDRVACTYRTCHHDGRQFWTESTFRLICDPSTGSPRNIVGTMRDVTGRGKTESVPERMDTLAERLIESFVDYAIYMLDLNGNVKTWNAGAQRITGYRAQEIIGTNFAVFYTDDDIDAGEPARVLAVARETGSCEAEGWRVRKDRSLILADVVVDAVRNESGSVIGFAKIARDVTHRLAERAAVDQAAEDLRHEIATATFAATHDGLTGLLNRRGIEAWIALQPNVSATLLYMDIDDFKAVNDRGGHAAGDETLRRLARIIVHASRDGDATARMGGDEFAVVLRGMNDDESAASVSERITAAVESFFPLGPCDETRIGVSIGISHLGTERSFAEALSEADADLYRKKSLHFPNGKRRTTPVAADRRRRPAP